ncbi:uncharacterized protein PRCAT00005239001 [Priceomyces carsonii]|uniref:uncharacterized protein n=1 Tax=Priceomyces carsonii TaxID=28549 RepID=UPI002ED8A78F|nr:unnamed protein product [Priceomyces carsonii]
MAQRVVTLHYNSERFSNLNKNMSNTILGQTQEDGSFLKFDYITGNPSFSSTVKSPYHSDGHLEHHNLAESETSFLSHKGNNNSFVAAETANHGDLQSRQVSSDDNDKTFSEGQNIRKASPLSNEDENADTSAVAGRGPESLGDLSYENFAHSLKLMLEYKDRLYSTSLSRVSMDEEWATNMKYAVGRLQFLREVYSTIETIKKKRQQHDDPSNSGSETLPDHPNLSFSEQGPFDSAASAYELVDENLSSSQILFSLGQHDDDDDDTSHSNSDNRNSSVIKHASA